MDEKLAYNFEMMCQILVSIHTEYGWELWDYGAVIIFNDEGVFLWRLVRNLFRRIRVTVAIWLGSFERIGFAVIFII